MAADLVVPSVRGTYRAMSCHASAVVVADRPGPLLEHVGRRLAELEARWSRFRPDSELSNLNAAGGEAMRCSPDTVTLVEAMVRGWQLTDGDFDPTLLATLVELGYTSSRTDAALRTSLSASVRPIGDPAGVLIDRPSGVVRLPAGTVLDPGGIGKGLAADLVVEELLELGAEGALVEIGGDLRAQGHPPGGDGWLVAVRSAVDDRSSRVVLGAGGVATSSSRLRTWRTERTERHHLVDPRTLRPTDADVVGCTVLAGSAASAEAFTKVAFVRGRTEALAVYDRHGLAARVTTEDGRTHDSRAWQLFGMVDR